MNCEGISIIPIFIPIPSSSSDWILSGSLQIKRLPVVIDEDYELADFLRQVAYREGERCRVCYGLRLYRAAQVAKKGRFDAFTTTLLVSPRQKHELIKDIGEAAGRETGIPFYYRDFRPGYREAVNISKEEKMYRQQYCGCIYSERDRYYKPSKGGCENE